MARSSRDEVLQGLRAVSNWGRWGPSDELGTLNYITPDKIRRAATLVRSGRVVSIAHDLSTVPSAKNADPIRHRMIYRNAPEAVDDVTITMHSLFQTHLDAVTHYPFRGQVYNGRAVSDVVLRSGLSFGSIHAYRQGVVTRGVLLDVARARGVDWLAPTDTVTAADLDAAEKLAGTRVESGDAVLVRVGLGTREAATGPEDLAFRAGLGPDCPAWFHAREVAVVGSDGPEQRPRPYPEIGPLWHIAALVYMGLCLLDAPDVEPLAAACAAEGRNEFLLTVAPLRIPRGTGSAVNPLCVF